MVYTCNSCNLAFEDASVQREHMKGDWHRYNLKRRVAQLPAVDEDTFNLKVSATKETTLSPKEGKKEERRRRKEELMEQKRQILETARRNMQKQQDEQILKGETPTFDDSASQKVQEEKDDIKETETAEQIEEELYNLKLSNKVEIPLTSCLFCHPKDGASFDDLEQNLIHMFQKHGLYIPESKYLVDKEGLIRYLGEKIGFGNVCLCCSYQGKDIAAVREHMKVKRHMRIPYESEDEKLEISGFYDFSSTYNEDTTVVSEEADGDDWEDVSGDESDDDELPRNDQNSIINNGFELILPTGKVLGHRSLQRYYRQNLPPERELSEGQGTIIAAEDRHMLNVRDKQEFGVQKLAWRQERFSNQSYDKKLAKNANFQKHYRDQLLQ